MRAVSRQSSFQICCSNEEKGYFISKHFWVATEFGCKNSELDLGSNILLSRHHFMAGINGCDTEAKSPFTGFVEACLMKMIKEIDAIRKLPD